MLLHACRTGLCSAPNSALRYLRRFDDRLVAHLDALSIAGSEGWRFCEAMLAAPSAGALFMIAVRLIEDRQEEGLGRIFAVAQAVPETRRGLVSAFGWLEKEQLQGTVASLLGAQDPFRRMVGIAACGLHRVDPGLVSARRILDTSPVVRARALRTAGEIGCEEAAPACTEAIRDDDPECGLWAAWSSVLLGNRGTALEVVTNAGLTIGPHRLRAFRVALQAMSLSASHRVLQQLGGDPQQLRWLIQGSGIAGDAKYVPWLIGHMANEKTARLAGEALTLIVGADLALLDLERKPPEDFESGPNDDPDDPNVDMDLDDGLPWPDPQRIERWWETNGGRFQLGRRYFMGAPVTREHCIEVLKNGFQRQRILAAHYLCLLDPGTPLFNTSAPAWRQQRLLAKMT
jgi:uncharacterized protein (TIGR02270 family)